MPGAAMASQPGAGRSSDGVAVSARTGPPTAAHPYAGGRGNDGASRPERERRRRRIVIFG